MLQCVPKCSLRLMAQGVGREAIKLPRNRTHLENGALHCCCRPLPNASKNFLGSKRSICMTGKSTSMQPSSSLSTWFPYSPYPAYWSSEASQTTVECIVDA